MDKLQIAVEKVAKGYSNIAFIKGRGGIGKSFSIQQLLDKNKVEYVQITGDITEAYLYRILYNCSEKIIWFSDVARLLKTLRSIELLKNATEMHGKRMVRKSNYSNQSADLPDSFEFKGRFIFDFNSLEGLRFKEDFEALITRGDFVELSYSLNDISAKMKQIAKSKEEKLVTEFLISNKEQVNIYFNLRTQQKAFNTYRYCKKTKQNWKEVLMQEIKNNKSETGNLLYSLIGNEWITKRELIKKLLATRQLSSLRTAERRINEWVELGELEQDNNLRNGKVKIL